MNLKKLLRILIVINIALCVVCIFLDRALRTYLPEPLAVYFAFTETEELRTFDLVVSLIGCALVAGYFVSLFGLWRLRKWGRLIYTGTCILLLFLVPFWGPSVMHGLSHSVCDASSIVGGMILALIWFSGLAESFSAGSFRPTVEINGSINGPDLAKRRPIGAALLSVIVPGLGQVYNGQFRKGIIFYFVFFILPMIVSLTRIQYYFYGALSFLIGGIALYLIIAGEAFTNAKKIKEITLKPYNKWYYYMLIVIFSFAINIAADDFIKKEVVGIKAYKIPSGTMMPTILIGDRIIVGLKHQKIQKGDIVVFKFPEDPSRDFIKRVIATENDILESKDKTIYINGAAMTEPYVQHVDNETKNKDQRDNFGPLTVPMGKVFVMGDDRDRSYDSRYWGYVDKSQIRGKALYFYWSKQIDKIGKDVK